MSHASDQADPAQAPPLGAYGLVLPGLPEAEAFMQPQHAEAPVLSVLVHPADGADSVAPILTADEADLPLLGGGRLRYRRGDDCAHYDLPERPPDEDLLHPYLAPAAALFWQWSGHEAIHAGAFAAPGGAVLILGDKAAGKSTTLARLAEGGIPVLTDDLAVLDGTDVLAGPRSIDLRPGSGARGRLEAHTVRQGERQRLRLSPVPASLPLAGVVTLGWGSTLDLSAVRMDQRLPVVSRQRTFPGLAPDPVSLLELASVPMISATRPPDLSGLDAFVEAMVGYFA